MLQKVLSVRVGVNLRPCVQPDSTAPHPLRKCSVLQGAIAHKGQCIQHRARRDTTVSMIRQCSVIMYINVIVFPLLIGFIGDKFGVVVGSFCGVHSTTMCPESHYCPDATTMLPCMREGAFCPGGSNLEALCPAGFHCPTPNHKLQCTRYTIYDTNSVSSFYLKIL